MTNATYTKHLATLNTLCTLSCKVAGMKDKWIKAQQDTVAYRAELITITQTRM